MYGTPFPKLLVGRGNPSNPSPHFMHLSLVKLKKYTSIDFFQYFSILVQEVSLKLEENFLSILFEFITDVQTKGDDPSDFEKNKSEWETSMWNRKNVDRKSTSYGEKKMYFEMLHINPLKVNLSYTGGSSHISVGRSVTHHSSNNIPNR